MLLGRLGESACEGVPVWQTAQLSIEAEDSGRWQDTQCPCIGAVHAPLCERGWFVLWHRSQKFALRWQTAQRFLSNPTVRPCPFSIQ